MLESKWREIKNEYIAFNQDVLLICLPPQMVDDDTHYSTLLELSARVCESVKLQQASQGDAQKPGP